MGLSRSLYTGWTGLATHQRCLDTVGNNLANINTVGFKESEFLFTNLLTQVVSANMPAGATHGSTSAITQGAGVTTGAITPTFRTGPMESTGRNLDVAINGNGFFLLGTSSGLALTRGGSFYLDHTTSPNMRLLCAGDGLPVQGWMAANGIVSHSTTVGNIYLPAEGDLLPGVVTTKATLDGILPTNNTGADFIGNATRELDLKGNLAQGGGNTVRTVIYAPITQSQGGVGVANGDIREIPVEISFTGPAQSPTGEFTVWNWRMPTVDWPRPGDPPIQIYPPPGSSAPFEPGVVRFHNQDDVTRNYGAGQVGQPLEINPGSTTVRSSVVLPNGETLDTSFNISPSFRLDVSRLTNLPSAPGGNGLQAWYVDGNVTGSMARTVAVYDQVTRFVHITNPDGTPGMEAVRRVEARQATMQFAKLGADSAGTTWSWKSSDGPAEGTLVFNTVGDLRSSTSSGGPVAYDFTGVRSINYTGSMRAVMQNGYTDGYLKDLTIDQYGRIFGHYTNEVSEVLGQLAMATVPNITGLAGVAGTMFYSTVASGEIMIGVAGDEIGSLSGLPPIGAGMLTAQHLEGSNVDTSTQLTKLITTERGYQANAKVVTTSDEMLQTLVGLKR